MAEQGFEMTPEQLEEERRARDVQQNLENLESDRARKFRVEKEKRSYGRYQEKMKELADIQEKQRKEAELEAKRKATQEALEKARVRSSFVSDASKLSADLKKKAEKAEEDAILMEEGLTSCCVEEG
jgi:undecaprenyl pyrophosphate synthase